MGYPKGFNLKELRPFLLPYKRILFIFAKIIHRMRRISTHLALLMALVALAGCGKKQHTEFWKAYDPVEYRNYPSDTSAVVDELKRSTPIEIIEKDSTGQWGCYYVSKKTLFGKGKKAWVPLDKLVYCGSENPEERLETFIVVPETLDLYNHPVGDKKDMQSVPLSRDDTVQITARSYSWAHIRKITYYETGHHSNFYGWVLESKLKPIDTLSYKEIDDLALAKAVKLDYAKMEEKYSPLMAKVHPWYRKACTWLAWGALGMMALFLVPAFFRSKFWHLFWMLPVFVLLDICGQECVMPTWFMMVAIPFMAYVICYPFLYFRTALLFRWIHWGVSLAAAGFYFFLYLKITSRSGLGIALYILLLLVILFGVFIIAGLMTRRLEKDICPYCGYFARHTKGPRRMVGESESYGSGTDRVYDGQTTEIRGNTKYIISHYHDEKYTTKTTTKHYEVDRKCMRCGKAFVNCHSRSTTRRV